MPKSFLIKKGSLKDPTSGGTKKQRRHALGNDWKRLRKRTQEERYGESIASKLDKKFLACPEALTVAKVTEHAESEGATGSSSGRTTRSCPETIPTTEFLDFNVEIQKFPNDDERILGTSDKIKPPNDVTAVLGVVQCKELELPRLLRSKGKGTKKSRITYEASGEMTSGISWNGERHRGTKEWKKDKRLEDAKEPSSYACSICGKCYATSSNLSRHKQTHRSLDSKQAKECSYCGKRYVSMPALSMHVLTHKRSHECQVCGKRFSRPWLLQGHIRSHTGERPFKCDECDKSFADRSNLRAHEQTHSMLKQFHCERCNRSFALKSYLTKHSEATCFAEERS